MSIVKKWIADDGGVGITVMRDPEDHMSVRVEVLNPNGLLSTFHIPYGEWRDLIEVY